MALMTPEQRAQVKRESKILEALAHPNMIKFEQSFKDRQENWNLVMEFADKGSLSDQIQIRKNHHCPFKEDELLNYIAQICLAVKYLHDRKVIHRNIKAANIFLSKHNQVKLGDFSSSKVLFQTNKKSRTMIDHECIVAPEVLGGDACNTKSDIWSLGILFHQLASLK